MEAPLLLVYTATSFTIAVLFLPVLIKLLTQWSVFDSPGQHKIHEDYTPSMGGICIMLGVLFTLLISFRFSDWVSLKYFFIALAVMLTVGLRDDILALDPVRKLIGQVLPIVILVVFGHTQLTSFYGMILTGMTFPVVVSWLVSIFTIVILTNAYNLIDGLDGLAGSVGIVILSFFGWWFFSVDQAYFSIIAFAFVGAIAGFLVFNWEPSKIFMGDTGALSIGLVISYLAVQFINFNFNLPQENQHFLASISTAICVLIIPVFDTARVIIFRLRRLQSPFKADRNHLHHQFINLGFSHAQSVLIICGINIFFIGLAVILRSQPDSVILPLVLALCLMINQALKAAQKKKAHVAPGETTKDRN